jgi:integration host factor subunit alpha
MHGCEAHSHLQESQSGERVRRTATRREIAQAVYAVCPGLSRREARLLVEQVLEEITTTLLAGENVSLRAFGKFELREKSSRPGRNPRTGELAPVSARKTIRFYASQRLRERVAGAPD